MPTIAASDLGNYLAEVLQRVAVGEEFEVLQGDQPVAVLVPVRRRRQWMPARELVPELERLGPDVSGLCGELSATIGQTTNEVS